MDLDLIFSVGSACRPAYYLKTNFLRTFACPLDWQMSYSLNTCLQLFQTGFHTFFSEIKEEVGKEGGGENRRIIDIRNSIISIHHFASDISLSEALPKFRAVMERRYLQLHNAILKAHLVGLICNREDSLDDLSTFLISFGQIYPNVSFILINIRNVKGLREICMEEYSISPKLAIREYSFHDEYFAEECREDKKWLGNINLWNSFLEDYRIIGHPFAEYIKSAVMDNKSIHLYGAGIYCRKIIHFLNKYEIRISDIMVTSLENNPNVIEGIPVLQWNLIAEQCLNDLVVISIIDQEEALIVYNLLRMCGFKFVIRIDSLLRIIP